MQYEQWISLQTCDLLTFVLPWYGDLSHYHHPQALWSLCVQNRQEDQCHRGIKFPSTPLWPPLSPGEYLIHWFYWLVMPVSVFIWPISITELCTSFAPPFSPPNSTFFVYFLCHLCHLALFLYNTFALSQSASLFNFYTAFAFYMRQSAPTFIIYVLGHFSQLALFLVLVLLLLYINIVSCSLFQSMSV